MITLTGAPVRSIAVLGAHCDDIAIGAGGTLLSLCADIPGVRVSALVLTGGDSPRAGEERAALAAFCPGATVSVTIGDLTDGMLPAQWERAKNAVRAFRGTVEPDLVLAPSGHDAHQDHRTVARLVPTEFRDHLILGYEIVKWEADLAQPSVFVPLPIPVARAKVELLTRHYPSQRDRYWFDDETFLGLARLRGVQCRSRYAEAFHTEKAIMSFGRSTPCASC